MAVGLLQLRDSDALAARVGQDKAANEDVEPRAGWSSRSNEPFGQEENARHPRGPRGLDELSHSLGTHSLVGIPYLYGDCFVDLMAAAGELRTELAETVG